MTGESGLKHHIQDFEAPPVEAAMRPEGEKPEEEDPNAAYRQELMARAHAHLRELGDVLKAENEAVLKLDTPALERFADIKESLFIRLSALEEAAGAQNVVLMGGGGALEEEIRALTADVQKSAEENLRLLKDLGSAVQKVAALHARAVENVNSEWLYSAAGRNLRAAELSPAGMKLEL